MMINDLPIFLAIFQEGFVNYCKLLQTHVETVRDLLTVFGEKNIQEREKR